MRTRRRRWQGQEGFDLVGGFSLARARDERALPTHTALGTDPKTRTTPIQGTALGTSCAVLLTLLFAYNAAMELHGKMSEITRKRPFALAEVSSLTRPTACWSAVVYCVYVFLVSFGLFLFFSFLVLWPRPVSVVCAREAVSLARHHFDASRARVLLPRPFQKADPTTFSLPRLRSP